MAESVVMEITRDKYEQLIDRCWQTDCRDCPFVQEHLDIVPVVDGCLLFDK